MSRTEIAGAVLALLTVLVDPAGAQQPVGAVVALEGQAEAQHPGASAWTALAVGDDILQGDQLRTLPDSRLRLLFRDDSVLTLAAGSTLTVDEQVVAPEATSARFSLGAGVLRALVPARYAEPGARFEVETPTAVAGVRGTEFIATYDPAQEASTVVGLADRTRVRARIDPAGTREVVIGPSESVMVRRGSLPLPPARVPADVLRGLSAATQVRHGGRLPEKELAPSRRGGGSEAADPRHPSSPRQRGVTPEGQVVDQPLKEIRPRVPPPPPPPPR